jgi:glycogen operon protein
VALDRPPALRLALDTLRYYAEVAGVDGFRFDLATTLGRRADGFDAAAPLLQAIEQDPVLRELKLIAEPWDVGSGGYRLGEFAPGWGEWNDHYRDAVRRFWRGEPGRVGELATRLAGSADVFAARFRPPSRSINFVAAHDGFTLADVVSYATKHNEANGEGNRDGSDVNHSWNHGVEDRRTMPRSSPRADATFATCSPRSCARAAPPCSRWAMSWAAPSAATTTAMRRTTRSPGSIGRRRTTRSSPSWQDSSTCASATPHCARIDG